MTEKDKVELWRSMHIKSSAGYRLVLNQGNLH